MDRDQLISKMLKTIEENPGIRPKDLNRLLNLEHSAGLRNSLIKQGFVIKQKVGQAVKYYATAKKKNL